VFSVRYELHLYIRNVEQFPSDRNAHHYNKAQKDPTKLLLHLPALAVTMPPTNTLHTALTAYLLAAQTAADASTYLKQKKTFQLQTKQAKILNVITAGRAL